jgi:hypothetical protein
MCLSTHPLAKIIYNITQKHNHYILNHISPEENKWVSECNSSFIIDDTLSYEFLDYLHPNINIINKSYLYWDSY